MADDDEIDILGDFNLSNFSSENGSNMLDNTPLVSQNSDLLNCDYTIHPQWLLDKPSANPENWYESSPTTNTSDLFEVDSLGHISTENCITDESGWTEKEKSLLHRGIEIFGKSSVRLSQFVGSKTASEVKYYLRNYFSENQSFYGHNSSESLSDVYETTEVTDVVNADQIPASIEEVIAVVTTGVPTVSPYKKVRRSSDSFTKSPTPSKAVPTSPNKNNTKVKRQIKFKGVKSRSDQKNNRKMVKLKFPTIVKSEKNCPPLPMIKQEIDDRMDQTQMGKVEITTGRGLSVPVCEGEEIIKIEHAEEDLSDISIDIEDVNDLDNVKKCPQKGQINLNSDISRQNENVPKKASSNDALTCSVATNMNLCHLNEKIAEQLMSLEVPSLEITLDQRSASELEKVVHYEFFEGRPSKTPERYLKIRNHIINNWTLSKPNYVNKTSMRLGLKNCGDVTCISRIHYFLEQIGAINFGCEQTKYERPLCNMIQSSGCQKEKSIKKTKPLGPREVGELGPRQRTKKKFTNDGEGGYTLTHGEQGQVINTTIVNEEPQKIKAYVKKPPIRLIYCRPFTDEKPQEYMVKITLPTVLLMDFHAHAYLTEVMGLVGGFWDSRSKTLTISCYQPCDNIASSSTHCDMCPISQANAAETIHNKNLHILGWFHSHPTFAPEPSQQDLDTQKCVQQWIGHNQPCIGVILSPFNASGALISSPFRCLMVDKKPNFEDQLVPYRFKVDMVVEEFNVGKFLSDMKKILLSNAGHLQDKRLDFNKPYFQDVSITHLEKFIFSVNMHFAKCGSLSKSTCDTVIKGVKDLLQPKLTS